MLVKFILSSWQLEFVLDLKGTISYSTMVLYIVMYIEIRMREGVAECDLIRTLQPRVSKELIHCNKLGACPRERLPKTLNS